MHQRHAARPRLESIEARLVLTVPALFDPTAGLRTAITALVHSHAAHTTPAHAAHHGAVHGTRSEAVIHHPLKSRTTHPGHPHASPPKSSTSGNSLSNFFKHLFGSTGL